MRFPARHQKIALSIGLVIAAIAMTPRMVILHYQCDDLAQNAGTNSAKILEILRQPWTSSAVPDQLRMSQAVA